MPNTYETITDKKFLDSTGVGTLWTKIRQRYDSKLDNVVATNDSVVVTGDNSVAVQISQKAGNALELKTANGEKGLYVPTPDAADTYTLSRADNSGEYAAVYRLMKSANGTGTPTQVGVDINIPKDMVVQSGQVVTKETSGEWGPAGTYIELTLANATNDKLYIAADDLIEYVTSGSSTGDMVVVSIDAQHRVTATITDGTITKAKLAQAVQDSLDAADSAVQSVVEGDGNGQIKVDGTNVDVHGLGSAAYQNTSAFDAAGAADAVLGTNEDSASTATVYGVKKYASDAYAAVKALTTAEIEAAITAANTALGA